MVGMVRTSNQFKGWGHALAFDGEIKGWVTPKSGPRTPNPIARGRNAQHHQGCIFYIHPCTVPHRGANSIYIPKLHCTTRNLLEEGGGEGKKECLVGFNSREAGTGGGFCFTSVGSGKGRQMLAHTVHSSTKGSRQSPLDPFAYNSIPQFVLGQKDEKNGDKSAQKNHIFVESKALTEVN